MNLRRWWLWALVIAAHGVLVVILISGSQRSLPVAPPSPPVQVSIVDTVVPMLSQPVSANPSPPPPAPLKAPPLKPSIAPPQQRAELPKPRPENPAPSFDPAPNNAAVSEPDTAPAAEPSPPTSVATAPAVAVAKASAASAANGGLPKAAAMGVVCPTQVKPVMPRQALRDGINGVVVARVAVKAGKVVRVEIVSSSPRNLFDSAVRTAVMQYSCLNSGEQEVVAEQEFVFKLNE